MLMVFLICILPVSAENIKIRRSRICAAPARDSPSSDSKVLPFKALFSISSLSNEFPIKKALLHEILQRHLPETPENPDTPDTPDSKVFLTESLYFHPKAFCQTIKKHSLQTVLFFGDPREIRTPDTLIRSQVLYPAELLGQIGRGRGTQTPNLRFWRPLLYQLRYAPAGIQRFPIACD